MRYARYDDLERDWDRRMNGMVRTRSGFAWGAFFVGFLVGAIIF
ncbi:MAG: hypothetical protein AAGC56_06300 [Pseudomonadota bacterium]